MRGHFQYLRFKTFSMTPRTPQCEVFWAFLSSSKHSGVLEDSKSSLFPSVGLHPTLGQSRVATESHLENLRLCFQKCRGYGIIFNLNKCAFMIFSGMILGFIVSKEKKLPNLKKIQAIINMPPPRNPHVATQALGSRPRQGLARLRAKREARESHLTLPMELPLWELEFRWTLEFSKSEFRGQNSMD